MKRILIIGAGQMGTAFLKLLHSLTYINNILVFDYDRTALGIKFARENNIPFCNHWKDCVSGESKFDFVFMTIEDSGLQQPFMLQENTTVIPYALSQLMYDFILRKEIEGQIKQTELMTQHEELKQVKTMLEAILYSFDDAISVVDHEGKGLYVNPAYTRITGLEEKDVIGKPATIDIMEGDSVHMRVLKTKQPVRGVRLRVGPNKKEVLVNVAPVIVDQKLRGSVGVIHDVSEIVTLTDELKKAKERIRNLEATYQFSDIIGHSEEVLLALEQAKVGAKALAPVLLRGPSGTGKELFAHAIHNESQRRDQPFIRVSCAALSEKVLEIELFGYVDGAIPDAKPGGKKGLIEEADGGSLFLYEISELSLHLQARLLNVIQEQTIVRIGGTESIKVDVRMIAATHKNLEKAIRMHRFSEQLYFQLNRLPIYIPPLKERMTDIPYLVEHVIKRLNQDYGRHVQSISEEALKKLMEYDWPGNVRELENVIGRAMIYMKPNEEMIQKHHLPSFWTYPISYQKVESHTDSTQTLEEAMEQFEKEYVMHAYRVNHYNKTKTAKALGISIRSLYYKIEKYQLDEEKQR
ncbi:MAG TPA: sigma 54-interacting transcriptional regulator [Cerasibacillus sp.]|uniref:sigma-54 interaction domain-containing protein n=1 Tax=Cerasibacillus sp. TaxID=2498711 RepID=UPI002F42508D